MTTLIAFGDSHVAGAEIDYKNQGECYEKAFSAKIANHFSFDYENYGQSGGSNDYIIKKCIPRIKTAIKNKEDVFLVIGICDPSRTYFTYEDKTYHFTTRASTDGWPAFVCQAYSNFLKLNTDEELNSKALTQILFLQSVFALYKIPYLMFSTTHFCPGDWSLINSDRYYGHHILRRDTYHQDKAYIIQQDYSYWGVCSFNIQWRDLRKDPRWAGHYPESFHEFWAEKMIQYIKNNNLLTA